MRYNRRSYLLHLILVLSLSTAFCTPSFAEGITLLSIGPRIGFGEKIPLMGKEAEILFPPVRHRSGHQAPLVLAAR